LIINVDIMSDILPQCARWGDIDEEQDTSNVEQDHQQGPDIPGVEMDMTTASELDKYDNGFDDGEEEVSEAEDKV